VRQEIEQIFNTFNIHDTVITKPVSTTAGNVRQLLIIAPSLMKNSGPVNGRISTPYTEDQRMAARHLWNCAAKAVK
jgi:hypothetical protein